MFTSDTVLWERWRASRDAEAFAELVSRHAGMVFATCKRILRNAADAEDAAQDCFLDLLRARVRVRTSIAPWLHTVAERRSRDRLKVARRRRERERRYRPESGPSGGAELEEVLDLVDAAVAELPEKLRVPVLLRFFEGRSQRDVARALDLSESTVAGRLRSAVDKIRASLRRRGVEVSASALALVLAERTCEAAPPTLIATLGKIALAAPRRAASGSTSVAPFFTSGGLVVVGALSVLLVGVVGTLVFWGAGEQGRVGEEIGGGALAPAAPPEVGRAAAPQDAPSPESPEPVLAVSGKVSDSRTGQPIAGAIVRGGGTQVATDTDGRFRLDGLRAGEPAVEATAEGYWAEVLTTDTRGENSVEVELSLDPRLDLRCVDPSGDPVAGASVLVVEHLLALEDGADHGAADGVLDLTTDTRGEARLRFPRSERVWQLGIFAWRDRDLAGFSSPTISTLQAGSRIELTLWESRDLLGLVGIPEGYDPRKVTVQVASLHVEAEGTSLDFFGHDLDCRSAVAEDSRWRERLSTRPGPTGEFRLPGLPAAARMELIADAPGLERGSTALSSPWPDAPVVVDLLAEGVIEGTLTYEDTGAPAGGVSLVATTHSRRPFVTTVDRSGRFRFTSLPEGVYQICLPVRSDRGGWALAVRSFVRASPGEVTRDVDLELERGAVVSGRVTNALTGEPIRTVVCAVNGPKGGREQVDASQTDDEGYYAVRLPRGESTVVVCGRQPEFIYSKERAEREVVVVDGETRKDGIDFQLMPASEPPTGGFGLARGRVVDADGNAVGGVRVRSLIPHDPSDATPAFVFQRQTRTDEHGRYELLVPADRELWIEAGGEKYSTAISSPVTVIEDEVREIDELTVRLGTGYIAGRVVNEDRDPILGVSVYGNSRSKNPGGGGQPFRTEPDGSFRLEYLVEGEPVRVTAAKVGYENVEVPDVEPGTTDLRIVLRRLDGALFRK